MEQDVEEDARLREARQKPLREREMGGRRDRQELGQTLDGAQQHRLAHGHGHRRILAHRRAQGEGKPPENVETERFGARRRGQPGLGHGARGALASPERRQRVHERLAARRETCRGDLQRRVDARAGRARDEFDDAREDLRAAARTRRGRRRRASSRRRERPRPASGTRTRRPRGARRAGRRLPSGSSRRGARRDRAGARTRGSSAWRSRTGDSRRAAQEASRRCARGRRRRPRGGRPPSRRTASARNGLSRAWRRAAGRSRTRGRARRGRGAAP